MGLGLASTVDQISVVMGLGLASTVDQISVVVGLGLASTVDQISVVMGQQRCDGLGIGINSGPNQLWWAWDWHQQWTKSAL